MIRFPFKQDFPALSISPVIQGSKYIICFPAWIGKWQLSRIWWPSLFKSEFQFFLGMQCATGVCRAGRRPIPAVNGSVPAPARPGPRPSRPPVRPSGGPPGGGWGAFKNYYNWLEALRSNYIALKVPRMVCVPVYCTHRPSKSLFSNISRIQNN